MILIMLAVCFASGDYSEFPKKIKPSGDSCLESIPVTKSKQIKFSEDKCYASCSGVIFPIETTKSYLYMESWCKDLHKSYKYRKLEIDSLKKTIEKQNSNKIREVITYSATSFAIGLSLGLLVNNLNKN